MLRACHDLGRNLKRTIFVNVARKQTLKNQTVSQEVLDDYCSETERDPPIQSIYFKRVGCCSEGQQTSMAIIETPLF